MNLFPNQDAAANSRPVDPSAIDWRSLLALFLGSRLLIWAVAGVSLAVVEKGQFFTPPAGPADWFMRWDAVFYEGLAAHGYSYDPGAGSTNVVFLPALPLLIRAVSLGGLIDFRIGGYLVSLACLWIACVWLWRAVAREWNDPRLATLAVAFLLLGPVSFFFSCLYSEALFLPLAIGCVDAARQDRWWRAGILGALAALTRFVGVILLVPLLWQYLESMFRGGSRSRPKSAVLLACFLPVAGFLVFCGFLWVRFGDPLLYFHAENFWGRHFAWFWDLLYRESFSNQPLFYRIWFSATLATAFGVLLAGVLLRMPVAYSLFALAAAGVYISARLVESLPRYFSVLFPLYVALALVGRRWPRTVLPLLATSTALLIFSVVLFVNGYWFT